MSAGTYTLFRRLGHGAMAEVFLARRGDGVRVALKRVMPHLEDKPSIRRRFEDECALALRLQHDNIVRAHEVAMVGESAHLVFEYIDGVTLKELLAIPAASSGAPFLPSALYVVDALLAALAYAHALTDDAGAPLDLVHRDISPSNVLLSRDGDVKLIDFGVATGREHADLTAPGALIGKVGYLPPEMVRAEPVDARGDLFSAGVLLFHMLTGAHPFGETPAEIVKNAALGHARFARTLAPWLAPPLAALLPRSLASDPGERFASAEQMRLALTAAGADEAAVRRGRVDVGALVRQRTGPERGEVCEEQTLTVTKTRTRTQTGPE